MSHLPPSSALPDRDLDWPTCHDVRDLSGLPTVDGATIRRGAVARADLLICLNAMSGGISAYLRGAGLTDAELAGLRDD